MSDRQTSKIVDRQKRVTDTLNSNLDRQLKAFENIQEWADIGYWLTRVENILRENPSPHISNNIQFTKRLAQCLNIRLPIGIHLQTLKLYEIVFNNMKRPFTEEYRQSHYVSLFSNDLALYSVGLFPFFKIASSQVKPQILIIIENYFFPLGVDIIPCLSGLVVSILPGLEDQNEVISRLVWRIMDELQVIAGRKYLIGCVWLAILKSTRAKNSGIKYLQKRLPKNVVEIDEDQEESMVLPQEVQVIQQSQVDIQDESENFPNKKTLVLNALISCLEEENIYIKRNALDFMYTHLNLKGVGLDRQEKTRLLKTVVRLLVKTELSLCRRIYTWMFDKPDSDNKYQLEGNEDTLQLIIGVLQELLTAPIVPKSVPHQVTLGLKVVQNFFMEHEHLVGIVLPPLAFPLMHYIEKHQNSGLSFSGDVFKAGERFLESIPSHYQLIVDSLMAKLESYVKSGQVDQALELVRLLTFLYEKFIHLYENLVVAYRLSLLLSILLGVSQSYSLIILSLETDQLLYALKAFNLLTRVMNSFLSLYKANLSQLQQQFQQRIQLSFHTLLDNVTLIYKQIVQLVKQSEQQSQHLSNEIVHIFNESTKFIFNVQKFSLVTDVPQWVTQMGSCLNSQNNSIVIITSELILEMLSDQVYTSIKARMETSLLEGHSNIRLSQMAISKLWNLVDQPIYQLKSIHILQQAQIHFPDVFSQVVVDSFNTQVISTKDFAIKRFAVYWKLTGEQLKEMNTLQCDTEGLFLMLDYMDHENPLLRHSSKNYLLDSIPLFYRILDPLLSVLLSQDQQVYDTKLVNEAFRKLKAILLVSSDLFIKYMSSIKLSETIKQVGMTFWEGKQNSQKSTEYYLDLVVKITLHYIKVQNITEVKNENNQVNASACEFLEQLTVKIEDRKIELLLIDKMCEELLVILKQSISNKDYVMEVQLLSLLKVIFTLDSFQSIASEKTQCNEKSNYQQLITSQLFMPNLLQGLNTQYSYVRVQFVNFISVSIPIISDFITQNDLTSLTIRVLNKYFQLLDEQLKQNIQDRITQQNIQQQSQIVLNQQDDQPVENQIKQSNTSILKDQFLKNLQSNCNNDDDLQILKQSDLFLNQKNDHEIYLILDGIRRILDYFLQLKTNNNNDIWDQVDNSLQSNMGIKKSGMQIFKDVLTLGLMSDKKEEQQKIQQQQLHIQESQQAILNFSEFVTYYLIRCFQNSEEFKKYIKFSNLGIQGYQFETYNQFNKIMSEKLRTQNLSNKNVKSIILQTLKPMTLQYSEKIMHAFIKNWTSISQKGNIEFHHKENLMAHQLELIVLINIPPQVLLASMTATETFKQLQEQQTKRTIKVKAQKNMPQRIVVNYQLALQESQILYFVYSYLSYVHIDPNNLKKSSLTILWGSLIKFVKLFHLSTSPNTFLWIADLLLLVTKKYSPKEILQDKHMSSDIHSLIKTTLQTLCDLATYKVHYVYDIKQVQSQLTNQDQVKHYQPFKIVIPYSPQVYNLYQDEQRRIKERDSQQVLDEEYENKTNLFEYNNQMTDSQIATFYRLITFKSLKNMMVELLRNSYSPEKTEKISYKIKELLEPFFVIVLDKKEENREFVEYASELLKTVIDSSRQSLVKLLAKNITEVFEDDDFFKVTRESLNHWGTVIDWLVQYDHGDLFANLLQKVTFTSFSLFRNQDTEDRHRIKRFQRICFIIFSGKTDHYETRLTDLLDKLSEVIKNAENQHSSLLIMILFCIRIIILRLSPKVLDTLFRNIWMMLLTLLIQIFKTNNNNNSNSYSNINSNSNTNNNTNNNTEKNNQNNNKTKNKINNPNLVLAALKVVELISVIGIDEFNLHQWIFVFDYFGIQIVENNTNEDLTPFKFQPLISNHLPNNFRVNYTDSIQYQPQEKRQLIITQNYVENDEQIQHKALWLCQYFIQNNEFRSQVEIQQIENMIVQEFITLDDYIYKLI